MAINSHAIHPFHVWPNVSSTYPRSDPQYDSPSHCRTLSQRPVCSVKPDSLAPRVQDFDRSLCCLPLFDPQKPVTMCPEVLLCFIQLHIALRCCQLKHCNDCFHTVRVTDEVDDKWKRMNKREIIWLDFCWKTNKLKLACGQVKV